MSRMRRHNLDDRTGHGVDPDRQMIAQDTASFGNDIVPVRSHAPLAGDHQNKPHILCPTAFNENLQDRFGARGGQTMQIKNPFRLQPPAFQTTVQLPVKLRCCGIRRGLSRR